MYTVSLELALLPFSSDWLSLYWKISITDFIFEISSSGRVRTRDRFNINLV
jgi:hypothetical protein